MATYLSIIVISFLLDAGHSCYLNATDECGKCECRLACQNIEGSLAECLKTCEEFNKNLAVEGTSANSVDRHQDNKKEKQESSYLLTIVLAGSFVLSMVMNFVFIRIYYSWTVRQMRRLKSFAVYKIKRKLKMTTGEIRLSSAGFELGVCSFQPVAEYRTPVGDDCGNRLALTGLASVTVENSFRLYALYKGLPRIRLYVISSSDIIHSGNGDILIDILGEPCDLAIMGVVQQDQQFSVLVADRRGNSVWKIECLGTRNQGPVEWLTGLKDVLTLAVSEATSRVCVTTTETVEIYSFSSSHLYSVTLPWDINAPTHSLLAKDSRDEDYLAVSHIEFWGDIKHRVCLLRKEGYVERVRTEDGRTVSPVFGSQPGHRLRGELNGPYHLAMDESRRVFVADHCNNRVLLLDSLLGSSLILGDNFHHPCRLWYDTASRYLIVGTSLDGIRVVRNTTELVVPRVL